MLKINCDICQEELVSPGALLFSPPSVADTTRKFHLCSSCYSEAFNKIKKPEKKIRLKLDTRLGLVVENTNQKIENLLVRGFSVQKEVGEYLTIDLDCISNDFKIE
jgi:hypothetical protein